MSKSKRFIAIVIEFEFVFLYYYVNSAPCNENARIFRVYAKKKTS